METVLAWLVQIDNVALVLSVLLNAFLLSQTKPIVLSLVQIHLAMQAIESALTRLADRLSAK